MKNKSNSRKRLLAVVALLGLGLSSWMVYAGTISAPSLTAILTDLINDNGGGTPNVAEPGETIDLTATIDNPDALLAAGNVRYQANVDPNTTLVPGSINATPLAIDDAYTAIGNVGLNVPAPGVLTNDVDPGGALPATAVTSLGAISTSQGGTVTMQNTGAFSYDPPAGFNGSDRFSYTIADSDGQPDVSTDDGVVSVTITVSGMIWFIDESEGAGGDGTLSSPFNSLAQHNSNTGDSNGDCIFVAAGSYAGGINLQNQQTLIGAGSSDTLAASCGITLPANSKTLPTTSGTRPVLSNTGGNAISLA